MLYLSPQLGILPPHLLWRVLCPLLRPKWHYIFIPQLGTARFAAWCFLSFAYGLRFG